MSRHQSLAPQTAGLLETYDVTIRHFFPDFWKWIDALSEPRKVPGRCQYSQRILAGTELLRCLTSLRSHREMDSIFNGADNKFLANLCRMTGHRARHVPRGQTINYWLSMLSTDGLKGILEKMALTLLDGKKLEICREPLENSLILGADGTGLISTVRNIGHSTTRHHRDGRCTNHVYVLLVPFLSPDGIVIPFQAEFIENGKDYREEFDKQDCEHKAETKLFSRIHDQHPRLPVTMLMDALSLDYTQMYGCIEKNWNFVISYRDGAVKSLAERIGSRLKDGTEIEHKRCRSLENETKIEREYTWFKLTYDFGKANEKGNTGFPVTYAKMKVTSTGADGKTTIQTYERITNFSLSSAHIECFFEYLGGTRWCEENQGFNEMKNLGLNIEHAYGCQGEAVVNHFLLQMIAFIIMQLAGKTDLFSKKELIPAKAGDNIDNATVTDGKVCNMPNAGDDKNKSAVEDDEGCSTLNNKRKKTMREMFSSLSVISLKLLEELTGRIMEPLEERIIKTLRVRWAYG